MNKSAKRTMKKSKSSSNKSTITFKLFLDFFYKRQDSSSKLQRKPINPAMTAQNWFTTANTKNDDAVIQSFKGKKVDIKINALPTKGMHQRTRSSVQELLINNQMIERPIIQNTNHLRSIGGQPLSLAAKKISEDTKFRIKTKSKFILSIF